jgi:hypothetical protein
VKRYGRVMGSGHEAIVSWYSPWYGPNFPWRCLPRDWSFHETNRKRTRSYHTSGNAIFV